MTAFRLIELLVLISAEASIFFERDAATNPLPWYVSAAEVLVFSALRLLLPWAQGNRRRTDLFFLAEIVLLIAIAANVTGAALIITSVSVCLRSVELVRPVRDASAYTIVTLTIVLLAMAYWARTGGSSWSVIGGWIVDLLLAWGLLGVLVTFAANERRNNDELRTAQRELIRYAGEAADVAAVRERARIALDLHDTIGHGLTALNVQLESALRLRAVDPGHADALVASAKALGSGVLADVRATVRGLRDDARERETAPPRDAIARVCERFERDFSLTIVRDLERVDACAATTTALVRIAEEALINVVRHAAIDAATVSLGRREGGGTLAIEDAGRGFATVDGEAGHGLAIMRERAAAAALDLRVDSAPARGTRVVVAWAASAS